MCYIHLLMFILVSVLNCEAGIEIKSNSELIVSSVRDLTCVSEVNIASHASYHQWNHVYTQTWGGFDSTITNYTSVRAVNSKYSLKLEKFDNLTAIYSQFETFDINNNRLMSTELQCPHNHLKYVINLVDDGYYHYTIDLIITYTEKTFRYDCQKFSHLSKYVYVAWINTEGNRILVFTKNPVITEFNLFKVHNGSMLCCVYYVETRSGNSIDIRRYVTNKTLLVYQESVLENGVSANTFSTSTAKNYCDRAVNISAAIGNTSIINKKTDVPNPGFNKTDMSNKQANDTGTATMPNLNDTTDINSKVKKESDDNKTSSEKKNPSDSELDGNPNSRNKTDKTQAVSGWRIFTSNRNAGKNEQDNRTHSENKSSVDSTPTGNYNLKNNSDDILDISTWRTDTKNNNDNDSSLPNVPKSILETTTSMAIGKNMTDKSSPVSDNSNGNVLIISVTAALVILVVAVIVIRRRCLNKTPPTRPQLALPRNEGENPFYLNLLFRRECELEMEAEQHPVYEEILYH